ncbi:MAG: hypothetical protein K2K86_05790, partial [Muribaculaceae bacterium]|nr:hypothetical protein [Muribaculaceae bacterium]
MQDSIVETGVKNPFGFLEKLGIDYEPLIANGGTLPAPSDKDCLLTTKGQGALLKGVISSYFDISKDTLVHLVAVRQITDDVILCQYNHRCSNYQEVYIATYNTAGVLIDALFAGELGDKSFVARNLSDSIELRIVRHNQIHFIGDHEFTLTHEYKETEPDADSGQYKTIYCKIISLTYNIESDGRIKTTLPEADVYEDGVFRRGRETWYKNEFDLMDEIYTLNLYPYSDEKALERWNSLGKIVDGAPAELFGYYFFI